MNKKSFENIFLMTIIIAIVTVLLYMFYLQNTRIVAMDKTLTEKLDLIATLEDENSKLKSSIKTSDSLIQNQNSDIEKLKEEVSTLKINTETINNINRLLGKLITTQTNTVSEIKTFMDFSKEEIEKYNEFKQNYNEEVLRGLSPLTIMKLYLYCGTVSDYETEYELYIQGNDYYTWTKEYHMNIPESDRIKDFGIFTQVNNVKINEQNTYADISWYTDYTNISSESSFNTDKKFIYNFHLFKNTNGIWKVGFLPMQ